MDVTLQLNGANKKATILFAGRGDFGFLPGWRKDLGDDPNPRMQDAVEFAQLAVYRYEAHSAIQPYAKLHIDIDNSTTFHMSLGLS